MCGALTVGALWVNLEESSMVLGLIWAAIGLIYLACVTKSFRNPVCAISSSNRIGIRLV